MTLRSVCYAALLSCLVIVAACNRDRSEDTLVFQHSQIELPKIPMRGSFIFARDGAVIIPWDRRSFAEVSIINMERRLYDWPVPQQDVGDVDVLYADNYFLFTITPRIGSSISALYRCSVRRPLWIVDDGLDRRGLGVTGNTIWLDEGTFYESRNLFSGKVMSRRRLRFLAEFKTVINLARPILDATQVFDSYGVLNLESGIYRIKYDYGEVMDSSSSMSVLSVDLVGQEVLCCTEKIERRMNKESETGVWSFDKESGYLIWHTILENIVFDSYARIRSSAEKVLVFGHRSVACMRISDGEKLWQRDLIQQGNVASSKAIAPILDLQILSGRCIILCNDRLLFLNMVTGETETEYGLDRSVTTRILSDGERIFTLERTGDEIEAIDIVSGRRVWSYRMAYEEDLADRFRENRSESRAHRARAAIMDDKLICISPDRVLHIFRHDNPSRTNDTAVLGGFEEGTDSNEGEKTAQTPGGPKE